MTIDVDNSCPLLDSCRVRQVAGLFDMPLTEKLSERFSVEVPPLGGKWRIGLIVGPSASGKTTLARRLFGADLVEQVEWPADRAVVDCFGEMPVREIAGLLTAVGFSSPPSWVKPYRVLSGGERSRCDLARVLAGIGGRTSEVGDRNTQADATSDLRPLISDLRTVAFDEFTSLVDRTAAKICSAAVAKAIRGGRIGGRSGQRIGRRFVAVTCHYDVTEWLGPDWVIDMATRMFARRRLRRPAIALELYRCHRRAWAVFAKHHYLSDSLNPAACCFIALWQRRPVAFCATLAVIGRLGRWRITQLVTLPDFQGVGIGMKVAEAVGEFHRGRGERFSLTASHPAVLAHCRVSPNWRATRVKNFGSTPHGANGSYRGSGQRAVASFEYVGPESNKS